MTIEQLLAKLNWFYSLELNQVDLYISQSKAFNDSYVGTALKRIAYIEQQHVDNIASKIREIGGKPTKIGDVISPIIGSIAGSIISLSGIENVLKINIFIEHKAMEDYANLLKDAKKCFQDKELIEILENNYVDEDLHTAWFTKELSKIRNN